MSNPSQTGIVKFRLSQKVFLPRNYTAWTHYNEGKERLRLEYFPSDEVLFLIEEQSLESQFKWFIKQEKFDDLNENRVLKTSAFTEVDYFEVQLEFD